MKALTRDDPERIGPYRLFGRLGEGGMGMVYLARNDRGRTVAVKMIRGELARDSHFRQRFAQEVNAARRVGPGWTAAVLHADPEADVPWVATEYIAGLSLLRVVDDHGPLPDRVVRLLAGGLARALHAIHGAGVLHRDLKPSNVLLSMDGPRVIDFGIARALEPMTPQEQLTRTGTVVGSPGFMSPEQVSGATLTPASDVFGLGCLLTYATTGRTPFGDLGLSSHQLLYRTVESDPDLDGVPDPLRELVAGCLARDPKQRTPLARLLAHPAPEAANGGDEPWLPPEIVLSVVRSAVSLLQTENPPTQAHWSDTTDTVLPTPPRALPAAPSSSPASPASTGSPGSPGSPPSPASPAVPQRPAGSAEPLDASRILPRLSAAPTPSQGTTVPHAPPRRWRPGRTLLAVLAAVVITAAVSITTVLTLTSDNNGNGNGGEDGKGGGGGPGAVTTGQGGATGDTPVPEGYLGAWHGQYGTQDTPGWRAMWLEIGRGRPGDIIGSATITYADAMCAYDIRLEAVADDRLTYTEIADHAIPQDEGPEKCRADHGTQSLRLQNNGQVRWNVATLQATLRPADSGGDAVVPAELARSWHDEWSSDNVKAGVDDITIEQGAVGDTVMRWTYKADGLRCVTESSLAMVEGDRILLSPETLVSEEGGDGCSRYDTFWARVDDGTLYLAQTFDLEDPYQVDHDQ